MTEPQRGAVVTDGRTAPADTLAAHITAYWRRVRGGDMGGLPAVLGIIVLVIGFSATQPVFFTATNFANLLFQGAAVMIVAMGLIFVLLLGEIDLSAGITTSRGFSRSSSRSSPAWSSGWCSGCSWRRSASRRSWSHWRPSCPSRASCCSS
jgi:hypothetical protein